MKKIIAIAAVTLLSTSASAWWGGPFSSGNGAMPWNTFADAFGGGDINFNAKSYGHGNGYGYGQPNYGYNGGYPYYGAPYGVAPYGVAPYGVAPYGAPVAPVAPQAPVAQ